jgi:hypothetical protein
MLLCYRTRLKPGSKWDSDDSIVVEHSTVDPEIEGSNPATACHMEKLSEKKPYLSHNLLVA